MANSHNETNIDSIPETNYFTYEEVGNIFKQKRTNQLNMIYMNIRTLPKNVSKLEYYLLKMNAPVDLIAISESKITKTANLVFENYINIPNYSFVNSRKKMCFWGGI